MLFTQTSGTSGVDVEVNLSGLKPFTKHGLHLHTSADLRDACNATGPHYNPLDQKHGSRNSTVRHLGDLGNIEANMNGIAVAEWKGIDMDLLGPLSVVGRSCVVHKNEDDLGLGEPKDNS